MKTLELPPIVRKITILADADEAGEEAAVSAGRRWRDSGLTVKIARPSIGADFNDALRIGGAR